MGFILFLLFSIFIFRFLGGFARIMLFSILAILFVVTVIVHLWWLIFLIIPFSVFSNRNRQREYVKTTKKDQTNTVDDKYDEVDDK